MSDFEPADLITVEIMPRCQFQFFEDIQIIPSFVRGAWFISSQGQRSLNVKINDPSKEVFQKSNQKEGIFSFTAKMKGQYSFVFENPNLLDSIQLTFTFHAGNSSDEVLLKSHLTPFEQKLHYVDKNLKDFWVDIEFAEIRQESYYKTIAEANKNVLLFSVLECVLECVVVMSLSSWQVYYIKRLLEHKIVI